jgi:penicillin-binding protein 1B
LHRAASETTESAMDTRHLFARLRRIEPRSWWLGAAAVASAPLLALVVTFVYFWRTTEELAARPGAQPSRLYAAPLVVAPGAAADRAGFVASLDALGYRRTDSDPAIGEYRLTGDRITLRLRGESASAAEASNDLAGRRLEVDLANRRMSEVRLDGLPLGPRAEVGLGRPLLWSYYDDRLRESRPVRLDHLPHHVVEAVLAAEDAKFFRHSGLAPVGIARAAWENARAGEVRQGGSTITQQLVKNLYLDPRRSFGRKLHEAVLALVLEARYGKEEILAAYLDEIYWGTVDGVNVHGLGAAARAYFDKEAAELDLAEAATLAGMIQAPGSYSPFTNPEETSQRRNWVLGRMTARGWVEPAVAAAAKVATVSPRRGQLRGRSAGYFAAAMVAEAKARFDVGELAGSGHHLFSTLSVSDQYVAEREVLAGLSRLERAFPDGGGGTSLQAALVSLDPRDGRLLAWVGGRDWATSQFDRISQARRQAGSAFKPVVFAAAFDSGRLEPWELLRDSPILVRFDRTEWRPRNSDGAFHGQVTPRTALELSLNVPTVRVAMRTGLAPLVSTARSMGFVSTLPEVPSLALGACDVTPLEVAVAYSTLAASGYRPAAWGLESVTDAAGRPIEGDDVPLPERALREDVAYLVTSMLRGVVDRGTAWRARQMGVRGPIAGKTGTTDDRRDNWFAGYSADRTTVVWVGYDENRPTRLSGSRGALPMWSRFVARVAPADGYQAVPRPAGFVVVDLDPDTGQLVGPNCPRRVREEMPAAMAPLRRCHAHDPISQLAALERPAGHGALSPAAGGEPTLSDLITRGAPESPPVRLRGDVTRLFGAGKEIQVDGSGSSRGAGAGERLGTDGPATRVSPPPAGPVGAGGLGGTEAPAAPSIVIEPARPAPRF